MECFWIVCILYFHYFIFFQAVKDICLKEEEEEEEENEENFVSKLPDLLSVVPLNVNYF